MALLTYYKYFLAAPRPDDSAVSEKDAFSVTFGSGFLTHPLKVFCSRGNFTDGRTSLFSPFITGISLYVCILRDNKCTKITI